MKVIKYVGNCWWVPSLIESESELQLSMDVRYAMIFIAYFNSSLNPIIYAGLNERFRIGFKETFCQRQQRRITPATGGPSKIPAQVCTINFIQEHNGSLARNFISYPEVDFKMVDVIHSDIVYLARCNCFSNSCVAPKDSNLPTYGPIQMPHQQ